MENPFLLAQATGEGAGLHWIVLNSVFVDPRAAEKRSDKKNPKPLNPEPLNPEP